jgi:hypothetical protein
VIELYLLSTINYQIQQRIHNKEISLPGVYVSSPNESSPYNYWARASRTQAESLMTRENSVAGPRAPKSSILATHYSPQIESNSPKCLGV